MREQTRINNTMASYRSTPGITILSFPAFFACVPCLAGCFVFNNPYDTNNPPPTATFQIVISSANYGGTYLWSPADNAYEAVISGARYYVYMDGSGIWHLSGPNSMSTNIANSTSPNYGTLPPQSSSRRSGSGSIISGIDDSEGGISDQSDAPDGPIVSGGLSKSHFWHQVRVTALPTNGKDPPLRRLTLRS